MTAFNAPPVLRRALPDQPSTESRRRLEQILGKCEGAQFSTRQLRVLRAIEVLERIGDPEALRVLRTLADGATGALATTHARAALRRLGK